MCSYIFLSYVIGNYTPAQYGEPESKASDKLFTAGTSVFMQVPVIDSKAGAVRADGMGFNEP